MLYLKLQQIQEQQHISLIDGISELHLIDVILMLVVKHRIIFITSHYS